jgi:hypothetical protein
MNCLRSSRRRKKSRTEKRKDGVIKESEERREWCQSVCITV